MSEAYLSTLGGNSHSLPGLDIGQVERERKEMWRKMFQKYEDMEEREELVEEVTVEDIDKPDTVNSIFQWQLQSCQMQPNSTLKQYFMEHAEEMDEIATIAGQTVSDEEVLGDDSDEELLYSGSDASNNIVDGEAGGANIGNNQLPLTPATSDDEENSDVSESKSKQLSTHRLRGGALLAERRTTEKLGQDDEMDNSCGTKRIFLYSIILLTSIVRST